MLSWDAIHPVLVHLPLGALLAVPLLVLLAVGSRRHRTPYTLAALIVLGLGTVWLLLAMLSGQQAADVAVQHYPEAREALAVHRGWATFAVVVFMLLTVLFAALTFLPLLFERKHKPRRLVPLYFVFLLLYLAGLVPVAAAGLSGGTLVHEHGVRVMPVEAAEEQQ